MNLFSLFKTKLQKDFFLAIIFSHSKVSAILFEEVNKKLSILATSTHHFGSPLDTISEEELIEEIDKVISEVEGRLAQDATVQKVLFGVPYEWVDQGKIKTDYLARLKKVCELLELTPIGFIIPIEAIIHFLQEKEGAPVSGVFIELADNWVGVYVARAGSIVEARSGLSTTRSSEKVRELLSEVRTFDVLPARIILLDHEGREKTQQEFLSYPWTSELPFLHLPAVAVLEEKFQNEAIIHGFAGEMGFELLKTRQEGGVAKEIVGQEEEQDDASAFAQKMGFAQEEDVAFREEVSSEEEEKRVVKPPMKEVLSRTEQPLLPRGKSITSLQPVQNLLLYGSHMMGSFAKKVVGIAFGLLLLLLLFSFGYYYFLLKAHVVFFLQEKNVDKTLDAILSSEGKTGDASNLLLPGEILEIIKENSIQRKTSGKKEIGEKAKGEVTIYNRTEQKKTFAKGTHIVGPNTLTFELMQDATVASTSAFSTTFSSVKASVAAVRFGPEYNFPSGSNFTFVDFPASSYFAKNESALGGGTKKEVSVVSKKDLEDLLQEGMIKLGEDAFREAQGSSGDRVVIQEALSAEILEKKYDKKEGEEAQNVSLTAKIKFSFLSYKREELGSLLALLAKEYAIPSHTFIPEKSSLEVKEVEVEQDKSAHATLSLHLLYLPSLNEGGLKEELAGKRAQDATVLLHKIAGVSEIKIVFRNRLPLFPALLPLNPKNIQFVKKTDG